MERPSLVITYRGSTAWHLCFRYKIQQISYDNAEESGDNSQANGSQGALREPNRPTLLAKSDHKFRV